MLSQQPQQQETKTSICKKCKKCNADIPNSKLYEHYQNCQNQQQHDQPNCNQVHENIKPNMIDDQNKLHQSSSTTISESQSMGFKMLKLCDFCLEYFQVEIYYNHQKECQKMIEIQETNISQNSQEQSGTNLVTEEVQEEINQEIVRSCFTEGGTYKKTVIKKDKQTGFTNYKTTYHKKQNKFLDNKNTSKLNEEITTNDNDETNQSNFKEQHFLDIDNFPTQQLEDDVKCLICNKQYEQIDQIKLFESCQHQFHLKCIKNQMCPICTQQPLQQK